jgi:hypothetical protein
MTAVSLAVMIVRACDLSLIDGLPSAGYQIPLLAGTRRLISIIAHLTGRLPLEAELNRSDQAVQDESLIYPSRPHECCTTQLDLGR